MSFIFIKKIMGVSESSSKQTNKNLVNTVKEDTHIYVLSSGGTGGHLFPALSVAREIESSGHKYFLVTDNRGVAFFRDHQQQPALVCNIHRKHWLFGRFLYPFSLSFQILRSFLWLLRVRPRSVIGFGGYPSFPCVYAAQLLGIPTIIHEGNAFLGKANRVLQKKAIKVALSFPPLPPQTINEKICVTGMPVRPPVQSLANIPYNAPDPSGPFNLLVIGGSQGAKVFGVILPKAIKLLSKDLQKRLMITQQCREQQLEETKKAYKSLACKVTLLPFIDAIEDYYKQAHLVIARAGASTVAEVAVSGRPTLFIPFQGSVEGDQARNASNLVEQDAAWVLREPSLTPLKLANFLETQMLTSEELIQKAKAIREFSKPNAAQNVWNMIQENIK
jgi:UDP-N-acetylglucosamine--N-acetylmuramyl-(pentapeptide) pyrophosphoryl-undecaprenol N-acetylglucosamine transferase